MKRPPHHRPQRTRRRRRKPEPIPAERLERDRWLHTAGWKNLRKLYLAEHPLCADPLRVHGKRPVAAQHVHHRVARAIDSAKRCEWGNLQALCARCHSAVEAVERRKEQETRA